MVKWWPGASTQVVHNKIMSSAAVCYASGCLSRVWVTTGECGTMLVNMYSPEFVAGTGH